MHASEPQNLTRCHCAFAAYLCMLRIMLLAHLFCSSNYDLFGGFSKVSIVLHKDSLFLHYQGAVVLLAH